ncbi:MAG: 50S ribosomal protein L11 methyltransferase, partial [Verrucomicrobia bacterium]|nr:50S ribosomal protein L11 methyltransferase [Verrucomicrobiota bacterium]
RWMHLWHKLAEPGWLAAHQNVLQALSGGTLVVISRPGRKRLQLEIACTSRNLCRNLVEEFGGRIETWPRDWLRRFADPRKSKPLRIGKRLIVACSANDYRQRCSVRCSQRMVSDPTNGNPLGTADTTASAATTSLLVIPASAAFGTGQHVATAMSLRFLEQLTGKWKDGWSLADLGTGSGILALAAKRFGAGRVTGIDIDSKAVSIAKANARLNKIDNVDFQWADVRNWKPAPAWDIIAANLYSELLIEILPKLGRNKWLILSGVLRVKEKEFLRALRRHKVEIVKAKRRGKWIAVLARRCRTSNVQRPTLNRF